MSERPPRMPIRRFLQRRVVAAEVFLERERWLLSRIPGGPIVLLPAVLVGFGYAALRPDLARLTLLSGAMLLAVLAAASLSQSSGIVVALFVAPVALLLPRDAVLVPRVVAALGLLVLAIAIPRAQRWFVAQLLDSPRGRHAGPVGMALTSAITVGSLVVLWGFVVPPMVLGADVVDLDDLTMSPLPVLALGVLAAVIAFTVALAVQTRTGVAPDVPLLIGPFGLERDTGSSKVLDPTDEQISDDLRHLASTLRPLGVALLNAEAVAVAAACPPDGDREAAPRIERVLATVTAGGDTDTSSVTPPPTPGGTPTAAPPPAPPSEPPTPPPGAARHGEVER